MQITNYRFTSVGSSRPRPMLWVRVTNPDKKSSAIIALAIVDTGADDCLFPAQAATQLGHVLKSISPKTIKTAGGDTKAYPHTSKVEILETLPDGMWGNKVLYTIPDTPIDFVVGCEAFLLGGEEVFG